MFANSNCRRHVHKVPPFKRLTLIVPLLDCHDEDRFVRATQKRDSIILCNKTTHVHDNGAVLKIPDSRFFFHMCVGKKDEEEGLIETHIYISKRLPL